MACLRINRTRGYSASLAVFSPRRVYRPPSAGSIGIPLFSIDQVLVSGDAVARFAPLPPRRDGQISGLRRLAVFLYGFIMHQQRFLGARVQQVDILVGKIQRCHPTAAGINDRWQHRDSATFPAAAYRHRQ